MSERTTTARLYAGLARRIGFDEARTKLGEPDGIEALFAESPTRYLAEQAPEIRRTISETQGLKLRVSAANLDTLTGLSTALPFACDLSIFSPAPLWPSCDLASITPCREFALSNSSVGGATFSAPIVDLMAWLVAVRPLIEGGHIVYLPISGGVQEPDARTRRPCKNGSGDNPQRRRILDMVSRALNDDLLVSQSLGAVHTLAVTASDLIGLTIEPGPGSAPDKGSSRYVAIRLPYLNGASAAQVSEVLSQEVAAFAELRRCVRAVVWPEQRRDDLGASGVSLKGRGRDLSTATEAVAGLLRRRLESAGSAGPTCELSWLTLHLFALGKSQPHAQDALSRRSDDFRGLARDISARMDLPEDSFFSLLRRS